MDCPHRGILFLKNSTTKPKKKKKI